MRLYRLLLYMLLVGLTVLPAAAKTKTTAERITITGPGLQRTIQVTDIVTLQQLSLMRFENFEAPVEPPEPLEPGYTIIRYFRDGEADGSSWHPDALLDPAEEVMFQRQQGFRPLDKVRYHADPAGGPGYVHYLQLNLNIINDYEGNWYRASEAGERAIQRLLAQHLDGSAGERRSWTWPTGNAINYAAGLLALAAAALLLRIGWGRRRA